MKSIFGVYLLAQQIQVLTGISFILIPVCSNFNSQDLKFEIQSSNVKSETIPFPWPSRLSLRQVITPQPSSKHCRHLNASNVA